MTDWTAEVTVAIAIAAILVGGIAVSCGGGLRCIRIALVLTAVIGFFVLPLVPPEG